MRARTLTLIAVLALVAAACSPSTDAADTTEGPTPSSTSTTAPPVSVPDATQLSYSLNAGDSYTYEVVIDQNITLTAEGDSTALGEEEIPGDMDIALTGTTTFTHSVAEGPEPGTYEVTITGEFNDLQINGTVDGEPIDDAEVPDFTGIEPIDVTVIVDEQGNIIPDGDEAGLFGDLGSLGGLGDLGSAGSVGQFIGPPFTEGEVTVGDSWSETIEIPGFLSEDPITTEISSEVTGTDSIDGHDVLVIETRTITGAIEFDLAEFLIGFMSAFVPDDTTGTTLDLEALAAEMRFLFAIDETVSDMTTWFDAGAGFARGAEFGSSTHMVIDINMPDDETGEIVSFLMDMNIGQGVVYRLVDGPSA